MERDHDTHIAATLNNIADQGRNVKPRTCGAVVFVSKSLNLIGTTVKKVVDELHDDWLTANYKILDAYYEATGKAKAAISNLLKHATTAAIELKKLHFLTDDTNVFKDEQLAKQELMNVKTSQLNLPVSILEELDEVKNAYLHVFSVCSKHLTQDMEHAEQEVRRRKIIGGVLTCVALAAAVIVPVVGIGMAVGVLTVTETKVIAGTALVVGSGLAIVAAALQTISKVTQDLVKQAQLIQNSQGKVSQIILNTEKLQLHADTVFQQVRETAADADLQMLKPLKDSSFREAVREELGEMHKLHDECRALVTSVTEAYDYFLKRISSPVVQRALTRPRSWKSN